MSARKKRLKTIPAKSNLNMGDGYIGVHYTTFVCVFKGLIVMF